MRKSTKIEENDEIRRIRENARDEAWKKKNAARANAEARKAEQKMWSFGGWVINNAFDDGLVHLFWAGIILLVVFIVSPDTGRLLLGLLIAYLVVEAAIQGIIQPMHNRNCQLTLQMINDELRRQMDEYDKEAEAKSEREIADYRKRMVAANIAYNAAYDKRVKQKVKEKMENVALLEDMRRFAVQYFEAILLKEIKDAANLAQFVKCTMTFTVLRDEIEYTGLDWNTVTHYNFSDARYRNLETDEDCEALACVLTGGIKGLLQQKYGPQQAVVTSSHDAATVTISMEMPNRNYQPLRKI